MPGLCFTFNSVCSVCSNLNHKRNQWYCCPFWEISFSFVCVYILMSTPLTCMKREAVRFINNRFLYCSSTNRERFFHFHGSYFISLTRWNNSSFNYVKTNRDYLLFAFFCINFSAFLIPLHWLVNQPLWLLLPCNVCQSFLISPDFKMVYHYLYKLLEMDSLPELLGPVAL